jgi:hypothetical protein
MNPKRLLRAAFVAAVFTAPVAWAQPAGDFARLSSQYAEWAGGRSNADSLVSGLRDGASVTLVTTGTGRTVSIAGFRPPARMSYGEVRSALANARSTLARMGIANPTAEEIQTALIGGEIGTRQVAGVLGPRAG